MDGDKPRGPGFGYLIVVAIAALVGWFYLRPLGLQVRDVLQSLINAFGNR
ncbi:MAG: hypothetical protein LV481_16820 [Methylacidiphilales bacterium]|nr:hypothetical protein [Candidatus Methylacidiphilales bacterium]